MWLGVYWLSSGFALQMRQYTPNHTDLVEYC